MPGRSATTCIVDAEAVEPKVDVQAAVLTHESASTMFIDGEPMKPATNRFRGWS